ncbi:MULTISPECIES: ATP-binding cassette domain-containing protein [unclassified Streptomyces]|uniref:ABC transporter ATP-binding protein n=1 Tax=unclassified Streptomyces TaxID=2593676 RepID=UPI0006F70DD8|nr:MULTISPECIES: ATP-binding cassette domain-containing protein [unclassified Streptomyces]KQX54519.1 ABC transporter ATP-binding protein [Streptomyces sp. Root1304]KRA93608.1 ABC transporter ATP-binding protein [Streptomyces sp. Root66D1]
MTKEGLVVEGLRKRYGDHTAVDDVSFTLEPGRSLALVGESGSGKTTTVRMLVGLERPDGGSVRLDGRDRSTRPRGRAERLSRAREIQMVFQDPYLSLDPRITVSGCLDEVLRLHTELDTAARKARVGELLDQVGLGAREAGALPRGLSGGQRQRVAIARALAVEPRVLVLDEAVAALDVSIQAQILDLLATIRREAGIGYLFVTHDLAVVRHIADEVMVLKSGQVVEAGSTSRVLDAPEHPYTRLLLASVPRRGWSPEGLRTRGDGA